MIVFGSRYFPFFQSVANEITIPMAVIAVGVLLFVKITAIVVVKHRRVLAPDPAKAPDSSCINDLGVAIVVEYGFESFCGCKFVVIPDKFRKGKGVVISGDNIAR